MGGWFWPFTCFIKKVQVIGCGITQGTVSGSFLIHADHSRFIFHIVESSKAFRYIFCVSLQNTVYVLIYSGQSLCRIKIPFCDKNSTVLFSGWFLAGSRWFKPTMTFHLIKDCKDYIIFYFLKAAKLIFYHPSFFSVYFLEFNILKDVAELPVNPLCKKNKFYSFT